MDGYMKEVKDATSELATNNAESFKAAGEDMSTYSDTVVEKMSANATAVSNLDDEMKKLGKEATDSMKEILAEAQIFEDGVVGHMAETQEAAENLLNAITALAEAMASVASADLQTEINSTNANANVTSGKKRWRTVGKGRTKKKITRAKQINKLRARELSKTRAYRNKVRELRKRNKGLRRGDRGYLTRRQIARKAASAAKKALKKVLKQKKWDGIILKYNTGGYTGSWSGNDGRLAMLHQKELVLNQSDTSNILKAVDMIRDISSRIDMNALAASGAFASGINSVNGVTGGILEQEVHITAEFPNATDRNEIQEAFNNVINLAAQYANRK